MPAESPAVRDEQDEQRQQVPQRHRRDDLHGDRPDANGSHHQPHAKAVDNRQQNRQLDPGVRIEKPQTATAMTRASPASRVPGLMSSAYLGETFSSSTYMAHSTGGRTSGSI